LWLDKLVTFVVFCYNAYTVLVVISVNRGFVTECTMSLLDTLNNECVDSNLELPSLIRACDEQLTEPTRTARSGDIITLKNLQFIPEHGFVPEPLFDTCCPDVALVLDWGNYLPGLHALLDGCCVGDVVTNVSVDAGWGARRSDLVFRVPITKLQSYLPDSGPALGLALRLKGGIDVVITEILDGEVIVIDANPPLAGTSYACSFEVVAIDRWEGARCGDDCISTCNNVDAYDGQKHERRYQMATFALGCFWGAELAFMRTEGVVGTRVGYSQGKTNGRPTYEEVSSGRTGHRESVQVIYDSQIVSYEALVQIALSRLHATQGYNSVYDLQRLYRIRNNADDDDDETKQYRNGFYFHSMEQRDMIDRILKQEGDSGARFEIEVLEASTFWNAEERHQQYLYKGGQDARKGAKQPIRCFG
jgi:peptide-methionine (S)-S-oxide reductase